MSVFNVLPSGVNTIFPTFWKHPDALFKYTQRKCAALKKNEGYKIICLYKILKICYMHDKVYYLKVKNMA